MGIRENPREKFSGSPYLRGKNKLITRYLDNGAHYTAEKLRISFHVHGILEAQVNLMKHYLNRFPIEITKLTTH